jgi:adenine-specific DNA-methyltransferase
LHATLLLNAADEGRRRCILVTNNELAETQATKLRKAGVKRGDPEWESHGVFEQVAVPRVKAAITGRRSDGSPVPGRYLERDPRRHSDGFSANVEFFRLGYVDQDRVELGLEFDRLLSTIWLAGAGRGRWEALRGDDFTIAEGPFAVLFRSAGMQDLLAGLTERPDVRTVFVITESEEAFADVAEQLPAGINCRMLWRDYLTSFSSGLIA